MRYSKLVAAALAALALSACIGFVVPLPVSDSSQNATDQDNRR